jgi:hypothetical protein
LIRYIGFIRCENGNNSLDLSLGDHGICNENDFGEFCDTDKHYQICGDFNPTTIVMYI